jgi:anhydro-N-acetylmuramic acid kinase
VLKHARPVNELLVCGVGLNNLWLIERVSALLPGVQVRSTADVGIDPEWMEAMAFAWLGWRTLNRQTGNACEVTGAKGDRVLGGVYYA